MLYSFPAVSGSHKCRPVHDAASFRNIGSMLLSLAASSDKGPGSALKLPLAGDGSFNIAQTGTPGKLCRGHGDKLCPAAHGVGSARAIMAFGEPIKFMSRHQFQNLREDCVMMGHGLDPFDITYVFANQVYQNNGIQAYLFGD